MTEVRVTNEATGGQKGRKAERYSLVPWEIMDEVARLYDFGSQKYQDHNWRKGYDWSLSFDALMRHATTWWTGEFDDPESDCDHFSSVIFHALALMYFRKYHPDLDDRYKGNKKENVIPNVVTNNDIQKMIPGSYQGSV